MQVQDITFTVDLDNMTPDRYEAIMRFVKEEGTGDINTYTYDPEACPTTEINSPDTKDRWVVRLQ